MTAGSRGDWRDWQNQDGNEPDGGYENEVDMSGQPITGVDHQWEPHRPEQYRGRYLQCRHCPEIKLASAGSASQPKPSERECVCGHDLSDHVGRCMFGAGVMEGPEGPEQCPCEGYCPADVHQAVLAAIGADGDEIPYDEHPTAHLAKLCRLKLEQAAGSASQTPAPAAGEPPQPPWTREQVGEMAEKPYHYAEDRAVIRYMLRAYAATLPDAPAPETPKE